MEHAGPADGSREIGAPRPETEGTAWARRPAPPVSVTPLPPEAGVGPHTDPSVPHPEGRDQRPEAPDHGSEPGEEDDHAGLIREQVLVERVPARGEVSGPLPPREEDGVIIVPLVEQVISIRTRWVLREEVRIRRVRVRVRDSGPAPTPGEMDHTHGSARSEAAGAPG